MNLICRLLFLDSDVSLFLTPHAQPLGHSGMYVCALTDLREMFFPLLPIRRPLASSPHLLLHVTYLAFAPQPSLISTIWIPRLCVLLSFTPVL